MNFIKPTLITLTAPTCSGKSYLLDHLTKLGFQRIVSTTTRHPRDGEIEGIDYNFISLDQSLALEQADEFAELVEFRGTRYGVTHAEMAKKMTGSMPPIVILEPQGVAAYEKYCKEQGWDIFKVFVSTQERTRIERLNARTVADMAMIDTASDMGVMTGHDYFARATRIIKAHTDRLISITGDERLWQATNQWNAIVPGTDVSEAVNLIHAGIKWQNQQITELEANQ